MEQLDTDSEPICYFYVCVLVFFGTFSPPYIRLVNNLLLITMTDVLLTLLILPAPP